MMKKSGKSADPHLSLVPDLLWQLHLNKLQDPSQPRPKILDIRHFRCHRNYENCIVKRYLIAVPQVVLLEVY